MEKSASLQAGEGTLVLVSVDEPLELMSSDGVLVLTTVDKTRCRVQWSVLVDKLSFWGLSLEQSPVVHLLMQVG